MAKYEKPELIVLSSKGQIVIPQTIRQKLDLKPKSQAPSLQLQRCGCAEEGSCFRFSTGNEKNLENRR